MTNTEENHKEGYQTPIEDYSKQDNQQDRAAITGGANQDDQLQQLNANIPEDNEIAKQQGASPDVDKDDEQ